jgi:hypothetical protein
MAMFGKRSTEIRRGTKVIAVQSLGKIPEGTVGVVKLIDGFKWLRYWVAWETGDWTGSVDAGAVVAADRYEEYKQEQAEKVNRPQASAAAATGPSGDAEAQGAGGVPEHLLERSRQARARKAAQSA